MKRYELTFKGLNPLIQHNDNLTFAEAIKAWRDDPANAALSINGDDRSPPWTWIGYLYHNGEYIGLPSDNIMTMFRQGGSKVPFKGKETFKKQTQSGIIVDQQQFDLFSSIGKRIPIKPFEKLLDDLNFNNHLKSVEENGFELFVKRAPVGRAKHVRARPLFRQWVAKGTITVLNEEISGLTMNILETILRVCGSTVGLCDWRPSSPKSGSYGTFEFELTPIK